MSQHDVVVVGAGFAGLSAARALMNAGLDVVVLEAREVVGGRTGTQSDSQRSLELGGQWTGPGQHRVLELASTFGVATFPTPHEGEDVAMGSGASTDSGSIAHLDDGDIQRVVDQVDALSANVPGEAPWLTPDAERLDHTILDDWLQREVPSDSARQWMRRVLEGLMTTSASDMSLLTILHAAKTSGTLSAAMGIEDGAQELRLVGGMHGLAVGMAEELGSRVRLASAVTSIRHDATAAHLTTASGDVSAQVAIVAVPPSSWPLMSFEPELPAAHRALPAMMPMGSVIKAQVVFDRPFWRDAGYSGLVLDHGSVFPFMVDNSPSTSDEGVLATFISASDVAQWSDAALGVQAQSMRRKHLIEHIGRAFDMSVPDPVAYVDHDWTAEPWIGGGYSGVMRPGGWTSCGPALREPVGRVHWASAESATMWTGYVDGAIQSGERAAAEVLAVLGV